MERIDAADLFVCCCFDGMSEPCPCKWETPLEGRVAHVHKCMGRALDLGHCSESSCSIDCWAKGGA